MPTLGLRVVVPPLAVLGSERQEPPVFEMEGLVLNGIPDCRSKLLSVASPHLSSAYMVSAIGFVP